MLFEYPDIETNLFKNQLLKAVTIDHTISKKNFSYINEVVI